MAKKLNAKEKAFVDEYLKDLNAVRAGVRAGYAVSTANAKCPLWVCKSRSKCPAHKRHIWDAVNKAKQERSERTQIDADWLLKRLAQEAEADVSDLYNAEGGLKPIHDWPEIWRKGLVSGFEIEQQFVCEGKKKVPNGYIFKIKVSDRVKRLELIGRHVDVQAFPTKVEVTGQGGGPQEHVILSKEDYKEIRQQMLDKDDC